MNIGPTLNFRRDLLPAFLTLVRERFGLILMRSPTLPPPTLVSLSASWFLRDLSSASQKSATLEPVLVLTRRPSVLVDTLVWVRERVLPTPVCLPRFFGCAVSAFSVVSLPSTETLARLTRLFTTSCTRSPRVTLSSTSVLWLSMLSEPRLKPPVRSHSEKKLRLVVSVSALSRPRDNRESLRREKLFLEIKKVIDELCFLIF